MEEFQVLNKAVLENENICSNCNKQLNVTPIYCVERNQCIEEICGRCVNIADSYGKTKKWRQYVFEKFGKFFTFPCSNKKFGCQTVLYWDDVVAHEKICTFQGVKCPIAHTNLFPEGTCIWEGNLKHLNTHIEESHKNYILNPIQIKWSDCKENMIFFTNVGPQIITIVIKYERESTYYCLLMVNSSDVESQCYRYQLELFDEDKDNSIILRKQRLEPLKFMCENLSNYDKMLEIDLVKIRQMLKYTKHIIGRFGIVKKSKKEIALIAGANNIESLTVSPTQPKEHKAVDEKILQELECPVCNEYMIPPIYICRTGHSICSSCKAKVECCPNCRDNFSGARNFTLEKLTARVNYPCRNRDLGCTFISTSDKIENHQVNCELSDQPCVVNCGWLGQRFSMYNHLKISHPELLLDVNTLHICDTRDKEIIYFLYVHGELFRFSIKHDVNNSPKKFNVQHIRPADGAPKFLYQLQIIDHSPLGLNLSFTNICRCLTDLKTAHSTALSIPWNLLYPFIFETHYCYYKILITKM